MKKYNNNGYYRYSNNRIVHFLIVGVGIGVSKKASKGLDSYFLGGKSIKWYLLQPQLH